MPVVYAYYASKQIIQDVLYFDYCGCYMLFSKMYVPFTICNLYLNKSDLVVLPEINAMTELTFT